MQCFVGGLVAYNLARMRSQPSSRLSDRPPSVVAEHDTPRWTWASLVRVAQYADIGCRPDTGQTGIELAMVVGNFLPGLNRSVGDLLSNIDF